MQSDGEEIKQQLIFSGLLLMIFEQFKKFSTSTVEWFFSDNMEIKEGNVIHKRGLEFKEMIKKFGKAQSGQHRNYTFRAALCWFNSLDAITKDELNEVERLYTLRNDVGHELFNILVEDCKRAIEMEDILIVVNIFSKLIKWWFKEVEATTNPFFIEQ